MTTTIETIHGGLELGRHGKSEGLEMTHVRESASFGRSDSRPELKNGCLILWERFAFWSGISNGAVHSLHT